MQTELIVALDVPSLEEMTALIDRLPDAVSWYKVGLELFCAHGARALEPLRERGKNSFLDLKLHDIPRTVAAAVRSLNSLGVRMLTIHASGGRAMIRAAADAACEAGEQRPRILAVSVLTSLGQADMTDLGLNATPAEQVRLLADLALDAGADGLVCSVHEAGELRRAFGPEPLLVTPGIRLAADAGHDQKRVATPADAVTMGASHMVVGRSIVKAQDPAQAAQAILQNARNAVS